MSAKSYYIQNGYNDPSASSMSKQPERRTKYCNHDYIHVPPIIFVNQGIYIFGAISLIHGFVDLLRH